MDRAIGLEIEDLLARQQFLTDNCDAVVDKGYMKPYTPEELQGHKENLANISIEIAGLEAQMKQITA